MNKDSKWIPLVHLGEPGLSTLGCRPCLQDGRFRQVNGFANTFRCSTDSALWSVGTSFPPCQCSLKNTLQLNPLSMTSAFHYNREVLKTISFRMEKRRWVGSAVGLMPSPQEWEGEEEEEKRRARRKVYLACGKFSIWNSSVPRGGNLWRKAHRMVSGSREGGLRVPTSPSEEHLQLPPSQD